MKIKRSKILLTSLMIGISGTLCLSFTGREKTGLIDHNQLASEYFNTDAQWYLNNIPFFECSDKKIQEVYYYRWKLYKAHIRNVGEDGYLITEFIDHVGWDKDPYCSINDCAGMHIYEGRWLKDNRYLDGYIDYMYRGGGNNCIYSENVADGTYARYLVNSDSDFVVGQLGLMQHVYNLWTDNEYFTHYDLNKNLYHIMPGRDATEYSIADIDAQGWVDRKGGESFRPTINAYMFGNALAISKIAGLKGDTLLSRSYFKKAADIKANVQLSLWNDSLEHFIDRYKVNNQFVRYWDFIRGRELAGMVPWMYNLPDNTLRFNSAWKHVTDTTQLLGKFGLRTVEPSYPNYMRSYDGVDCQWNGPSWPFQTTQTLEGMANLLNNYTQDVITPTDYLKILRLYTQQHYFTKGTYNETGTSDGQLNIVENYNPDNGKSIVDKYRSSHYLHSCYNDLIITGLCGIRPSEGYTLTINPLIDQSIQYFCLSDVTYHGHKLTLVYDADGNKYKLGKGLTVFVDGKKVTPKANKGKYEVEIGAPELISKPNQVINLAFNLLKKGYPAPSASINSVPDSLYPAIDGRIWYFPEMKNRWSTVDSNSTTDWYAIDFGELHAISSVKIYLYVDGKTYGKPDDYSIEYRNIDQWLPVTVKERNPLSPVGNTVNTVDFDRVIAKQIRVNFKHEAKGLAVAVAEVECY